MKKAIIIGEPGVDIKGFAEAIGVNFDLPLYYLNNVYKIDEKDLEKGFCFSDRVSETVKRDEWIICSSYDVDYLEIICSECDTIFLFDYPKETCRNLIGDVDDISWYAFVRFFRDYKPEIFKKLEKYTDKSFITFKTEEEKNYYIDKIIRKN